MFGAIWTKSLRDYRFAVVGWSLLLGLIVLSTYATFTATSFNAAAQASVAQLTQGLTFFGEPVAVGTIDGFVTWKAGNFVALVFCIWAVLAGARMIRGDEERGALELLLAVPRSRTRVVVEKAVAFALACLLVGLVVGLSFAVGQASARIPVDLGGGLLAGLDVALLALVYGALALLLGQVLRHRSAAAGVAGALLALGYVLDGTARAAPSVSAVRWVSPFFYFGLSKPVVASYGTNWGALLVLLLLALGMLALAGLLFAWRDIGGVAFAWPVRTTGHGTNGGAAAVLARAGRDLTLRTVGLRALGAQRVSIFWWSVGMAVYAWWGSGIARASQDAIRQLYANQPAFAALAGGSAIGSDAGMVSLLLFSFLPEVIAGLALMQAISWAADIESGRGELVLATPQTRRRVLLERFGAVVVASVVAVALTYLGAMVGIASSGLQVDAGRMAAAVFGMLPAALVPATAVYALVGTLRVSALVGILGGYLGLAFFIELLGLALKLPTLVMNLSIFHAYGTPLTTGPLWGNWLLLLAVAAALLLVGERRFARLNVPTGS